MQSCHDPAWLCCIPPPTPVSALVSSSTYSSSYTLPFLLLLLPALYPPSPFPFLLLLASLPLQITNLHSGREKAGCGLLGFSSTTIQRLRLELTSSSHRTTRLPRPHYLPPPNPPLSLTLFILYLPPSLLSTSLCFLPFSPPTLNCTPVPPP